jgi:hypothetical protein
MPAARKTAENSFRLPAPADRWIQAKAIRLGLHISGVQLRTDTKVSDGMAEGTA